MALLKMNKTKDILKNLEKTFKGIGEVGDGIESLRKGVNDLKV